MKRTLLWALTALILLPLLLLPCSAAEVDISDEIDPEDGLSEQILESIGRFDADESQDLGAGILRLVTDALKTLSGTLRSGLQSAGVMLCAVLLCSLLSELSASADTVRFAGVLGIVGAAAGGLRSMISLASQTLMQMREYSLLLLPGLSSLSVFSGGAVTGAAVYTGSVVFFDVLLRVSSSLVLPLVWLYIAVSAADAALGGEKLTAMGGFLQWLATGVLKWTSYLFTGYLAVTGVLCGTVDAAQLRTAKAALSTVVPLVGSIISDASDALLSSAALLKNAAGVYGMLAILAICLTPFFRIGVQLLLLRGTQAVAGLFEQPQLTALIGRLAEALRLLLALTGAFCLAAVLSIVLCMKAVGA